MYSHILAKDAMTTKPVTCSSDISILQAVKLMSKKRVGSLLVTDKTKLLGLLTEKDIINKIVAKQRNAKDLTVGEVMSTKLITAKQNISLDKIAELMLKHDTRKIPIVDNGILYGLITEKDLLRLEPSIMDILIHKKRVREMSTKNLKIKEMEGLCEFCDAYTDDLREVNGFFVCKECSGNAVEK